MANDTPVKVPHYKIEVDGKEISAEILSTVEGVEFEEEINTASMFVIKLAISDMGKGAWKYLDLGDFKLGSEVKFSMGMDKVVPMIVGEVTSLEPSFSSDLSTIEVRGFDRLHRLRFGKKRRTFANVKESDIAASVAGDWGLSAEVEDTGTIYPGIYQNNQSDFEFLLERVKRLRYEVLVRENKLYFRKSRENDAVALTLEYKINLDEFSVKSGVFYEGNEIIVQGWDVTKKEAITAKAQEGNEVSQMSAKETGVAMVKSAFGASSYTVVGEHIVDTSNAEQFAVARFNQHLGEFTTGDGCCAGIPELRAGTNIEIKGIGRFSGIYYVVSTLHTINRSGYTTSFKVRRVGI